MAALSIFTRWFPVMALLVVLQFPTLCLAQRGLRDVNDLPWPDEQDQIQTPGGTITCPHKISVPKVSMSVEESCSNSESVEVILPMKPDASGIPQEKRVRGAYEFHEYHLRDIDQDAAYKDMMGLFPMDGFIVKYAQAPSTITAQRGDTWALVSMGDESYNVSVVRAEEVPWAPITTAAEIAKEMDTHNHADIYGIQFSAENRIQEDQSPMLAEILKYLKENPTVAVVVQSHKWTKGVTADFDIETTRERANAVMDWLIAHGVARTQVQPRPYGRNNPLTENDTPNEVKRNDRIVIAKAKV